MHTAWSPNHPHNEWYEELCALVAIGEVSPSEFEEFQRHLADCGVCRELYSDFRRLASDDLGSVAVLGRGEQSEQTNDPVDEKALLAQLLNRASRERERRSTRIETQAPLRGRTLWDGLSAIMFWLRRPALSYGSLGLILCAGAAIGAYRLREAQLKPKLEGLSAEVHTWMDRARAGEAKEETAAQALQDNESQRKAVEKALAEAQAKYADLQKEEKDLRAQLAVANGQVAQDGQALQTTRVADEEKNKQIADLENRLQAAVHRTEEEEFVAENLRNRLQAAEQTVKIQPGSPPESQGFNDADAKALFGARDLHIVDVYDVDIDGKTRRTYGRVYYVEKKLLTFYAFDLQDKKHNRAAAGFQAWGYREANQAKPESLGLFSLDDASINRWVLKVNNPRVLERIDAVYVTLEPPNGSPSPRGRRLLYANLAGPANHP